MNVVEEILKGYKNFVRRDINFLAGGLLILFLAAFDLDKTNNFIVFTTSGIINLLFVIFISYFVGIFAHESFSNIKPFNKILSTCTDVIKQADYYWLVSKIREKLPSAYLELERIIFFKEVGSKLGWSSIYSIFISITLFFIYHQIDFNTLVIQNLFVIIFLYLCYRINRFKSKQHDDLLLTLKIQIDLNEGRQ